MNLAGNISSNDLNRVHGINNPPEHEGGFEEGSESNMDDIFDFDDSDIFGSDSGGGSSGGSLSSTFGGGQSSGFGAQQSGFGGQSGGFGAQSGGFGGFGAPQGSLGSTFGGQQSSFGGGFGAQPGGFGVQPGGFGAQPGGFGMGNGMAGQQGQMQTSEVDKMVDASIDAAKSLGFILIEMVKSIKLRTIDDYGYLGSVLITTGAVLGVVSAVIGIVGSVSNIALLSFSGLPLQLILSGVLTLGTGLTSIGVSAMILSNRQDRGGNIEAIPDIENPDNVVDDFEDNIGAESDDLFSDDFDSFFEDFESGLDDKDDDDDNNDTIDTSHAIDIDEVEEEFNPDGLIDNVEENQVISRERLYRTFKGMFTFKTPNFADKTPLDQDSETFLQIQTACLKALSNILGCELEDVRSSVISVYDSFFSYEIRMDRVKKMSKLDEFARELEIYFRSNSKETGVSASVDMEGDFYKIVISKGESAVITFGDIFKQQYCEDFFLNTKKKLPIITGITELGEVILDDAKIFDSMIICGKPRSGKSWYVLSILMSLALFNSPEDVQFVIVDPKESNLFKTFALMPHVCGLHNDAQILEVMDDLISNEGPRRKKLLADHRVDDIWALREKGLKLPILYLVIDEYITARNNLGENYKELDKKLQTIISQLPSLGIRVIFIPHRATGIVDRTNRTMLQFNACVKSDQSEVIDTLDIKKWNRPLVNPGDIAIKTSSNPNPMYVRGAALTTSDSQNTDFIRTAARAFYKMGVELPRMDSLTLANNRDNDYIRKELTTDGQIMQFSATDILEGM